MRKKIISLCLIIVAVIALFTGCGGSSEQKGAETTVSSFADALAAYDVKTAKACLKDGTTDKIVLEGGNYDRENMIARYMEAGISEEKASAIMDKVTETNKKAITYKVKDIKTKGNKATVTVTFSVKKPEDLWDEILVSDEVLEAYGTGDQGDAVLKSYALLSEKLEVATPEPINVKFTLENADGKWLISQMDENIAKIY